MNNATESITAITALKERLGNIDKALIEVGIFLQIKQLPDAQSGEETLVDDLIASADVIEQRIATIYREVRKLTNES